MPDVLVRPVSSWRGSADQAIITDMTALVAERGAAVAVALVSCDRGFATALRFCRGHGCPTVWISAMNTKRCSRIPVPLRYNLMMERALMSWRRKLPQTAADVNLCWEQIMSGP
ncbi:g10062 [Coccomyxa elongata]